VFTLLKLVTKKQTVKAVARVCSARCVSFGWQHTEDVCSFVLPPRGTVCLIHSKTLLCHCLVFRIHYVIPSSLYHAYTVIFSHSTL